MSEQKMVSVPEGYMLVERSIWTEQQVEAASACITRLKAVPGMRDQDLAMAAIDAAQCKAPEISLADILPAAQHQGEPVAKRKVHIEVRECEGCNHIGIDDAHGTLAACHSCDWSGPEPIEDKCPLCGRDNVIAAACPDCGSRYMLAASKFVEVPADGGEVERLRDGLKYESQRAALCLEELQECETQRDEFYAEITGLREKLAEREALLLEVVGTGNLCAENEPTGQTVDLNDRIEALLAASAAPEVKS